MELGLEFKLRFAIFVIITIPKTNIMYHSHIYFKPPNVQLWYIMSVLSPLLTINVFLMFHFQRLTNLETQLQLKIKFQTQTEGLSQVAFVDHRVVTLNRCKQI